MSIIKKYECIDCGAELEIKSYRKYVVCPFCGRKATFEGFDYQEVDYTSSMLVDIEYESDCPSCRGKHMVLRRDSELWRCIDCGYKISLTDIMDTTFWFCDECDTFLNIQPGFEDTKEEWKCSECGHLNDITEENVF